MLLTQFPIFSVRRNLVSFAVLNRTPASRGQDCVLAPEICRPQRTSNQSKVHGALGRGTPAGMRLLARVLPLFPGDYDTGW